MSIVIALVTTGAVKGTSAVFGTTVAAGLSKTALLALTMAATSISMYAGASLFGYGKNAISDGSIIDGAQSIIIEITQKYLEMMKQANSFGNSTNFLAQAAIVLGCIAGAMAFTTVVALANLLIIRSLTLSELNPYSKAVNDEREDAYNGLEKKFIGKSNDGDARIVIEKEVRPPIPPIDWYSLIRLSVISSGMVIFSIGFLYVLMIILGYVLPGAMGSILLPYLMGAKASALIVLNAFSSTVTKGVFSSVRQGIIDWIVSLIFMFKSTLNDPKYFISWAVSIITTMGGLATFYSLSNIKKQKENSFTSLFQKYIGMAILFAVVGILSVCFVILPIRTLTIYFPMFRKIMSYPFLVVAYSTDAVIKTINLKSIPVAHQTANMVMAN